MARHAAGRAHLALAMREAALDIRWVFRAACVPASRHLLLHPARISGNAREQTSDQALLILSLYPIVRGAARDFWTGAFFVLHPHVRGTASKLPA